MGRWTSKYAAALTKSSSSRSRTSCARASRPRRPAFRATRRWAGAGSHSTARSSARGVACSSCRRVRHSAGARRGCAARARGRARGPALRPIGDGRWALATQALVKKHHGAQADGGRRWRGAGRRSDGLEGAADGVVVRHEFRGRHARHTCPPCPSRAGCDRGQSARGSIGVLLIDYGMFRQVARVLGRRHDAARCRAPSSISRRRAGDDRADECARARRDDAHRSLPIARGGPVLGHQKIHRRALRRAFGDRGEPLLGPERTCAQRLHLDAVARGGGGVPVGRSARPRRDSPSRGRSWRAATNTVRHA